MPRGVYDHSHMKGDRNVSKRPEVLAKLTGPNNHTWRGGLGTYFHSVAFDLFGKG